MKKVNFKFIVLLVAFLLYTLDALALRIPPVATSVTARRIVEQNSDFGFSHFIFWLSLGCLFFMGRMLQPWVVGLLTLASLISAYCIWG